jgi:Na+-translocating ferredoxin:NAD+ oxidoreductase subunit C
VSNTFPRGGVHPPENKITAECLIERLPVPATVTIPLLQHIGATALPVVAKGEKVLAGQLIGKASGFVSSNIHSSVSGTVSKIDVLPDSSGYKQVSIVIDVSGDEWINKKANGDSSLTGEMIIAKCLESGIVGLGGAAFPTHVKLKIPSGKKCDLLIINGVECEPFLTSDHRIMVEKSEEVIDGVSLLMKALNVSKVMIGIEENKPDAIEKMRMVCKDRAGFTVSSLKVKYPQGGEKQLIKSLINREVPHGGLPVDVGVVVQNVGTAFAVHEAIRENKPLVERVVTITGKHLTRPGNYIVRIGTPVSSLIEAAGGLPENTGKIIVGGPMMGRAVPGTGIPVIKSTSGIVVFPKEESERMTSEPCIRCGRCITACGVYLEPYLLMSLSERGLFERAEKERITDCMECGSCSYICPARRPLLDYIRLGKSNVIKMIRQRGMN